MGDHSCLIGIRKFEQWVVVVGNPGIKCLLNRIQMTGGRVVMIAGI